ncbi:MAG: hypothetical protein JWO48_127 [Bryobacterales bacterium]|nr:hypothetical protein [Bryobacterales bacterium]
MSFRKDAEQHSEVNPNIPPCGSFVSSSKIRGSPPQYGVAPRYKFVVIEVFGLVRKDVQRWSKLQFAPTLNRRSGFDAQKCAHAIHLRPEFALEVAIVRWLRFDITELRLKLTVLH